MSELRQDPITGDWVIVSPERRRRPNDEGRDQGASSCPFCPGHESMTPPSLAEIVDEHGQWLVRAVANRFALIGPEAPSMAPVGAAGLPAHARHEVIIEARTHEATFGTLPTAQLRRVLEMYRARYRAIAGADPSLRQIVLFRNHGSGAGTSLRHPHSQIMGLRVVAPEFERRMQAEVVYFDRHARCGICETLKSELAASRRILNASRDFVAFCPYAAALPYQMRIVPRRHMAVFDEATDAELDDLAPHLDAVLGALFHRLDDPDYNLIVSTPPLDAGHARAHHWRIDVVPRLTVPGGFELGSHVGVSVETPEGSAARLRVARAGQAS